LSNQEMERKILAIVGKCPGVEGSTLWQTLRQPDREQYHKVMVALLGAKRILKKVVRDEDGNVEQVEFALPKTGERSCATKKVQ